MPQLKVQNQYRATLTSSILATGDIAFTVTTPPTYTNGFIVLSPDVTSQREVIYFYNVVGNTIYARYENRSSPKAHSSSEAVQINDVAEIFNAFSDMISQAFYVEKTGGLNVKVWGGYVLYNGNPVTVADTNLVLTDNTTNYIKYNFTTNTISVDTVNGGNIKAVVVTLAGVITSIAYRFSKESLIDFTVAITGALPSQSGHAGEALLTDGNNVSWGFTNHLRAGMLTAQNIGATNGSPNITVADTTGWVNGATITGTGIPGGTTILSFVANTSAILSANFTGTTGTVSATVGYKQLSEYDATGAEVKRPISAGASILSTDLFQKINPSTRAREEVTYAMLKNDLSSAGSFIQSVEMGEAIGGTYSVTSFVPELTSDTSAPGFTVGYSGQYDSSGNAAWNAFNVNSAGWFIPNASPGLHWIKIVLPFPVVFNSFWVSKYDARGFDTGWKIQGSNDGSSWTDLYTAGSVMSTTYTNYTFSNTTPYAQYRLLGNFSGADSCGINRMNFDGYYTLSNPVPVSIIGKILYQNTLPSSAGSSKTRVGNRFMFPYAVRLRNFKTWQTTSTSSGTVIILDSSGNTLKTIALASGAQIADLDFVASANTEYRVVLNDSANWNSGSTYGTQTTALYQATMPYALGSVSGAGAGTLDGANCVIFTECEVDYQNKGFRSKANTVKEVSFVNFSGFVIGSKSVGDIVDLNKTAGNLLDGFTGLTKGDVLYISNVAGAVSTTPGTIKNPIGLSVSATSAILGSVSTSINTLMSYSISNGGTGVTNYGEVGFIPGGQYSYTLVTTSGGAGAVMTLQWSYNGTDSWKDVISTTGANQTLTGSGSLPTGYIRGKQLSSAVSGASSITILN